LKVIIPPFKLIDYIFFTINKPLGEEGDFVVVVVPVVGDEVGGDVDLVWFFR
jgi:hypothetical protein